MERTQLLKQTYKPEVPSRTRSMSTQRLVGHIVYYVLFTLMAAIVFVPILLVVFGSFKTNLELAETSPFSLPQSFLHIDNYVSALKEGNMIRGLGNSVLLVVLSMLGNMLLGTMTAYVLNRFQFRMKKVILMMFMAAMIIPAYTTEIARFQLIHALGVYNTLGAPLLIYIGTDIMQIYIYMQFLEKISVQLDESAMLDGASYVRIFRSIIFPLLLPATATLAILKSVTIMNDIFVQQLYMPSAKLATLATSLTAFVSTRSSDLSQLCAGIIIVLLPSAIFYIVFQRYIFKGLMDGAVKG
ncbi:MULTISPECIES: carbohydrate ABC transporter permease [Paenibacillus]|uniref:Carbohydrate ABC transporter permease n=2 Tax=Paenibacillus TaxID=44249 RepID=A0ABU6DC44_9BACL|nr:MULTISPECIES: carbohydrate ABC transporter permease [Paenibacillus]MCY9656831.1 carbohydrate ABC transporter permease [Paenibacillus anseongense]MEB4794481.1 carbohydrate ABC transporter permease [Paenibacillus chondroitinus]